MTRTEFVKAYAARSGISDKFAVIGLIDIGPYTRVAMPCACGEEGCEGWAMVSSENIDHHLLFCAPDELRLAYAKLVRE